MRTMTTLALLIASVLGAQAPQSKNGAVITGRVLDPGGMPVANADVFLIAQTQRGRTDSAGRFEIGGLDGGFYRVRVRRVGFLPNEQTTDVGKNGKVDLTFELLPRPAMLDSVIVTAEGRCAELSFSGFNCRKRSAKGVFLTDDDLLDRGAVELGDIFRDVKGFRIEMIPTPFGAKPRPLATTGAGCLNALVNGRAIALTNQLPRYAYEVIAVEIYARANDVPPEYERYVWQRSARQSSTSMRRDAANGRCSLVNYWTSYGR